MPLLRSIRALLSAGLRSPVTPVCLLYVALAIPFAMVNLDQDEFTFIREPYELLGGDYTAGYLAEGDPAAALRTAARAYFLYWNYRPLFSPIVAPEHQRMFAVEEEKFGYQKRESVDPRTPDAVAQYSKKLVVPEPDRLYSFGSGKPLLSAIASIPQLGVAQWLTQGGESLIEIQHRKNYHPIFIVVRWVQLLSGLVTLLLVYHVIRDEFGVDRAVWGSAVFALFPISLKFFPNLHHDSVMVPFAVLAVFAHAKAHRALTGVGLGLALAAKNAAIFLLPVLLLQSILRVVSDAKRESTDGRKRHAFVREAKGLVLAGGIALALLVPFANPISYAEEILTPISGREFDPRGEDVRKFMTATRLEARSESGLSTFRPEVVAVREVLYFDEVAFFFFALTLFGLLPRCSRDISRVSLVIVLLSVPFGLVFGHSLGYRSLLFVPFFAIACGDVLGPRALRWLCLLLAGISLLYVIDPVTTSDATYIVEDRTFLEAIGRWFR